MITYGYDGGFGGFMSPFMFITWFVWTAVGIFAIIWLWQQISKK